LFNVLKTSSDTSEITLVSALDVSPAIIDITDFFCRFAGAGVTSST